MPKRRGQKDEARLPKHIIHNAYVKFFNIEESAEFLGISASAFRSMFKFYRDLAKTKPRLTKLYIPDINPSENVISYNETPGSLKYEERYIEERSYKTEENIETVGKYYLPNGQLV